MNAPERLTVPFGTVSAWRLKPTIVDERGTALGHNLTIWLGNDPRRLPVKVLGDLPVGSFVLSLRDAR